MSNDSSTPTTPPPAPEGFVNIEIDGVALVAPKGSMIIEAADKAGISIPRFCYHKKLSIAASCRQCMVDVEKSPKPAPACATPVMEGMKIYTQSKRALDAQRNVTEFLLINHPLDCPVCDQGGDCELQDVAMGYGRSVGRFVEKKRTVPDEDIGPLVATEMTRCIHCTRCVRVLSEIAGTYEFGSLDRGDRHVIGTYIGKNIESELSGNIIDVCPVGALTNKPFQFKARPWELVARASIGYHDALGSNLWMHLRRGEVLRCVPRENEPVNESWLSDRDRYSHAGLKSDDRLSVPMIRTGDTWREASWDEALAKATEVLKAHRGDRLGMLVNPAVTNEEGSLLAALAAGLDCGNLDHRIAQADLADAPVAERFEMSVEQLETADVILLIGSNPRHEAPLLAHRLRKAQRRGAKVVAINPVAFDLNLDVLHHHVLTPSAMLDAVLEVATAAGATLPGALQKSVLGAEGAAAIADLLKNAERGVIVLGESAAMHVNASWLRVTARALAKSANVALNILPLGANAVGLSAMGVLPRARHAQEMLTQPRSAYVLYGIEPEHDFADTPTALKALGSAEAVVAFTAYADATTRQVAQVMLPIGLLPEIDGSLVNVDGLTQSVAASAKLPGEARAGWRVLRALGERLGVDGFDFTELSQWNLASHATVSGSGVSNRASVEGLEVVATRSIYRMDAVVRRSAPLQAHPLSRKAQVFVHTDDARSLGLEQGGMAKLDDGRGKATLPVAISDDVPHGAVWIEKGTAATAPIAATGSHLSVTRA